MIAELIKNRRLELGFTITSLSHVIGVTHGTISSWERGLAKPSQLNLAKLARALEWNQEVRFDLLRLNENKGGKRLKLTEEFYDLLHELEDEFKSMTSAPEDDERLDELRMMVGTETLRSQGYDKKKVEKLRIKNNLSKLDVSVALGRSKSWFTSTFLQGPKVFTKQEAEMFADFFEVEVEVFKK